jgi:diketogulonate reductase-like aldo/keto reductase
MEEIYNQKKALRLGISNCYDLEVLQKLYDEAQIKPSILQNRFYADSGYDKELREWCLTHDVTYQSFWSLTANPHLLSHPLLQTLSVEYNKTAAQIFFRFLIQIGIIPLTGTSSSKHMREDLSIFDFALTPKEQSDIELLLV